MWASSGLQAADLGNETSWHYDLGVYHQIAKKIDTRAAIYYIDIDDYHVVDSGSSYYQSNYAYNLDTVEFYGFELEFNSNLTDKIGLFGNYTYQETTTTDSGLSGVPEIFWLNLPPKHKFNLGLRYRLLENTLLTTDLRYMGEKETEGGLKIDDATVIAVGVEQTLLENVKLQVFVNNLFDEDYQEVYGYPMPGINYGVQVKMSF